MRLTNRESSPFRTGSVNQKEIANISDEEAKELIREIGFVATSLKRIFGNLTFVIEDYLN